MHFVLMVLNQYVYHVKSRLAAILFYTGEVDKTYSDRYTQRMNKNGTPNSTHFTVGFW